jgi:hypothetical protein
MKKIIQMNKIINIDWLQINCIGFIDIQPGYEYKKLPYNTRHFKDIWEIYKGDQIICTLANKPLSPILNPAMNLIKFDNSILYRPDLLELVLNFINIHKLMFKNITRLDICIDFNLFDCNLHPETLIKNYLNNKYFYTGRSNYKIVGKQQYNEDKNTLIHKVDYLRFGANTSPVATYLYNKSKEMREAKFKNYIFEFWEKNNLNINKDIWRLEFSIKGSSLKCIDRETGLILPIDLNNLKHDDFLYTLFFSLVEKYFKFKIFDNKKTAKYWKQKELFFKETLFINRFFKISEDYTRADKIFIKKLENLNNELRGKDFNLSIASDDLINYFIRSRNIEIFYLNKIKK